MPAENHLFFSFQQNRSSFFRVFQGFCFKNHLFLSAKKTGGPFSCPERSFLRFEPPVFLLSPKRVVFFWAFAFCNVKSNHLFCPMTEKGGDSLPERCYPSQTNHLFPCNRGKGWLLTPLLVGGSRSRGKKPLGPEPAAPPCTGGTILLAGRRAGVPLWPVVCPMPAGGSAVKGRQRGGRLPVAERASPLTALRAAGTHARINADGANTHGGWQGRSDGRCHLQIQVW